MENRHLRGRDFFRRLLAAVLSILLPGFGQTYNRQPQKGMIFLLLLPAYVFFAGAVRLVSTFHGFLLGAAIQFSLLIWATVDSVICGGNKILSRPGFSKARLWFSIAVLLVVINSVAEVTNFALNRTRAGMEALLNPNDSMAPTLIEGDRFASDTWYYKQGSPQRGDVVMFEIPGQDSSEHVKRIIALGGDTIEGKKDGVYVNGERLNEPYLMPGSSEGQNSRDNSDIFGQVRVPAGNYFLLGDNRQDSFDSRYFGAVPASKIKGRALYIYFSRDWAHIGKTIR